MTLCTHQKSILIGHDYLFSFFFSPYFILCRQTLISFPRSSQTADPAVRRRPMASEQAIPVLNDSRPFMFRKTFSILSCSYTPISFSNPYFRRKQCTIHIALRSVHTQFDHLCQLPVPFFFIPPTTPSRHHHSYSIHQYTPASHIPDSSPHPLRAAAPPAPPPEDRARVRLRASIVLSVGCLCTGRIGSSGRNVARSSRAGRRRIGVLWWRACFSKDRQNGGPGRRRRGEGYVNYL